jgi:hypothetical protein
MNPTEYVPAHMRKAAEQRHTLRTVGPGPTLDAEFFLHELFERLEAREVSSGGTVEAQDAFREDLKFEIAAGRHLLEFPSQFFRAAICHWF